MLRHRSIRTCSPVSFRPGVLAFVLEVDHHDKRCGADEAIELPKGQTRLVKLYNALRIRYVWRLDNVPILLVDDALIGGIHYLCMQLANLGI
jgi:hypothetical protein